MVDKDMDVVELYKMWTTVTWYKPIFSTYINFTKKNYNHVWISK